MSSHRFCRGAAFGAVQQWAQWSGWRQDLVRKRGRAHYQSASFAEVDGRRGEWGVACFCEWGARGDAQVGRAVVGKDRDRLREAGAGDGAGEFDRVVDRDGAVEQ